MLTWSRKTFEKRTIGENITVTIYKIKDGQVKIGIDAPTDVVVMRDDAVTQAPKTKNKLRFTSP